MWTYRGYDRDSRGVTAPRILALQRWLVSTDPGGKSLGTYAHRPVRGGATPSVHQTGRAIDWQPSSHTAGYHLWDVLRAYPEGADIDLIIWEHKQWGGRSGPVTQAYHGVDPHTGHLHIETRSWE